MLDGGGMRKKTLQNAITNITSHIFVWKITIKKKWKFFKTLSIFPTISEKFQTESAYLLEFILGVDDILNIQIHLDGEQMSAFERQKRSQKKHIQMYFSTEVEL